MLRNSLLKYRNVLYRLNMSRYYFSNLNSAEYKNIKISQPHTAVGLIQLNRPRAKNALNSELISELNRALSDFEKDEKISCIVLGGEKEYFAAGADIKEMKDKNYSEVYATSMLEDWNYITKIRKPIVASVNGWALGGGCELAMMCDIIIAGENAVFGQPEIKIGTIPGCGGTQRLTRAIGKSRTMEMILTGEPMKAQEALSRGLVSRVVPAEKSLDDAIELATKIAKMPRLISIACKEAVNSSYENTLQQGLNYEKRLFWATFATEDRKIGMEAFANKQQAEFKNK